MGTREAITVRFPVLLLERARQQKGERESLNEFVVEAVQREIRRRQGVRAVAEIAQLREEIRAKSGLQDDSTTLIRLLREGDERGG